MARPPVSVSSVRVSLTVSTKQRTDAGACGLCSIWRIGRHSTGSWRWAVGAGHTASCDCVGFRDAAAPRSAACTAGGDGYAARLHRGSRLKCSASATRRRSSRGGWSRRRSSSRIAATVAARSASVSARRAPARPASTSCATRAARAVCRQGEQPPPPPAHALRGAALARR